MLSGHLWTIAPTLKERLKALPEAPGVPWKHPIRNPEQGDFFLHGIFHDLGGATLVVIVHGLGGSPDARYIKHGTRAVLDRGMSCLRLGLRGSDRRGGGIYHAGLTADIHSAIASMPQFRHVMLMGYSMGGQTCALAATEPHLDPRVVAVAAMCSPLDMATAQQHMDAPKQWIYRRHVLQGLLEIYTGAAEHHSLPGDVTSVQRLTRFRQYDEQVIAPHFGFDSPDDYYQRCSLTGRASQLRVPMLSVAVRPDPMIPLAAIERGISGGDNITPWVLERGGHCYFPAGTTADIVDWLHQQVPNSAAGLEPDTRKQDQISPPE